MIEDENPDAIKRASIEEVPLGDETATDRAFRCLDDGRIYRVRVARVTPPEIQGGKEVADHYQAVRFSITELVRGSVNRFGSDRAVLLVDSIKTILPESFGASETPEQWLRFEIEQEIYNASQTRIKQDGLTSVLKSFGG